MMLIPLSMKLFVLEINMNGNEVVEVILKGGKVEYAIAREWMQIKNGWMYVII